MSDKQKISIALSPDQKQRWESHADRLQINVSSFVRRCVEAYIAAVEKRESQKQKMDSNS